MTRLFSALSRASSGRLLWVNLALLIALKGALFVGDGGLASIAGTVALPDSVGIVAQTNEARRSAGLPALTRNAALDLAAEQKLNDMAAAGYFAHVSPAGRQAWDFIAAAGYRYGVAGENLARGFSDPAALVKAWMGSPSHRANLMSASYRDIGVSTRRITLDGTPATVVVQLFAAPRAVAAVPVPVPPAPRTAAAPQHVSTQVAIAPVAAPVPMVSVAGAAVPPAVRSFSGMFTGYLAVLMGLFTMAAGWVGWHRRLTLGWLAHAAIIAALLSVPQFVPAAQRFIF